jgi:IS5 family transposase
MSVILQVDGLRCHYAGTAGRGQVSLAKNTAQIVTLFALSNLWMARRRLMQVQA